MAKSTDHPPRPAPSFVLFDCDGVLVDSEPIALGVVAASLRECGVDISDDRCIREFAGLSQEASIRVLTDLFGGEIPLGGWPI